MSRLRQAPIRKPDKQADDNRRALLCWLISFAMLGVPQAAAPMVFAFVALSLTGETSGGAVMMLAMTLAQVAGAIPITRLGNKLPAARFLKLLVVFRTLALAAVALCAHYQAPFFWLVILVALAGTVSGAAYGYLRAMLNCFTPASHLPRTLGIAAILNEAIFVLAPVAASGLSSISSAFAVFILAAIGALPALLIPPCGKAHIENLPQVENSTDSPYILLWLICAAAEGAIIAAVEIGAVALALKLGYRPSLAILITVPLCLASVSGGVWVSMRNRKATRRSVLAQMSITACGSTMVALGSSLETIILGAVLIGSVMAPLGTYFALVLDELVPPQKRSEVFAMLRMANAVGILIASAALATLSLSGALMAITFVNIVVTLMVWSVPDGRRA